MKCGWYLHPFDKFLVIVGEFRGSVPVQNKEVQSSGCFQLC